MIGQHILMFAGTTEARLAVQALLQEGYSVTASVATDYGSTMLENTAGNLFVVQGRRDVQGMIALMREKTYFCVIDATHPYAQEATTNILSAAKACSLPYYRLLRDQSENIGCTVNTAREALGILAEREGNILLTTGSKDLAVFTELPNYASRVYPRVLPFPASVQACLDLGYAPSHIIAMQGPFSQQLNHALLHQYNIGILVTKNSGPSGGYPEKVAAAKACHAFLVTIGHEAEQGYTLTGLLHFLERSN